MLIVYDEHGGLYDHVVPPACKPDGYVAQPADTVQDGRLRSTGLAFAYQRFLSRLGLLGERWFRVPKILPTGELLNMPRFPGR